MAWRGNENWDGQEILKDLINSSYYYLSIAFFSITLVVGTAFLISCIHLASKKVAEALVGEYKGSVLRDGDK